MLSLLIPTYNYNVVPLVLELQNQCSICGIEYEIIVLDDGSNLIFRENDQLNNIENCRYLINEKNTGRASNINKLVELAKFDYVLILEADAFPKEKNYIQRYVESINQNPQAVFGGVIYSENKPQQNSLLRWIYGNARESKSLEYRLENPFDIVFSWNLLIRKNIFLNHSFDSSITTYGFEDLVFLKKLKENNIQIQQIENSLIHQNEELSTVFIEKSKAATLNLIELYRTKMLSTNDSSLLNAFEKIKNVHLTSIVAFLFTHFENAMIKNLLSEKPSLFLFDLYRLGYFCQQFRIKYKTQ
jgi:glycosyltransferase involved in cell wall biosynthesis